MTRKEEIEDLESRIRHTFAKDVITKVDVSVSKQMLDRWKYLTKYTPDKTPVLKKENHENSKR